MLFADMPDFNFWVALFGIIYIGMILQLRAWMRSAKSAVTGIGRAAVANPHRTGLILQMIRGIFFGR